jgi:hypothetical protein
MLMSTALRQRYDSTTPHILAISKIVKETLLNYCEQKGYAFQCRLKEMTSLAQKIESGRYRTWYDLDDLFACTIIVPRLSDETRVEEFCSGVFHLHEASPHHSWSA